MPPTPSWLWATFAAVLFLLLGYRFIYTVMYVTFVLKLLKNKWQDIRPHFWQKLFERFLLCLCYHSVERKKIMRIRRRGGGRRRWSKRRKRKRKRRKRRKRWNAKSNKKIVSMRNYTWDWMHFYAEVFPQLQIFRGDDTR